MSIKSTLKNLSLNAFKDILCFSLTLLFSSLAYSQSLSNKQNYYKPQGSATMTNSYLIAKSDEESSLWDQASDSGSTLDASSEFPDDDVFQNKSKKKKKRSRLHPHWGFGLGISPTTIQVQTTSSYYNLKGTGFLIRILYDKPLNRFFTLMGGATYLPLSGTQADSKLGTAKFEANYTALEMNARFNFQGDPQQGVWLGGGGSYLLGHGSSNVVASSSITNRFAFQASAGYNASMGNEFLMLRGDYYIHPEASSKSGYVKIAQSSISAIYFY